MSREQPFKVERIDPRDVNIAYDKDGPVEVENIRTGETWTREQAESTAPHEADEVRRAREAVIDAADLLASQVDTDWEQEAASKVIAALDAFERAVEADLFRRAAVAAERFDLTDAKLPPHMPTETLLAEWMARAKAAEARAETSDMAANAAIDVVAEYRERLSRLEAALEEIASVCAPDGEPDSNDAANTAVDIARAALKAGEGDGG